MSAIDQAREIVSGDLDSEFVKALSITLGWKYSKLYDRLLENPYLSEAAREEEFGRQRGICATEALAEAATAHRIPFNFRRLECNGQTKILVKAGRVVLIQEPMLGLDEGPRTAAYKRELADTHAIIRQLELDLGDQPSRIRDWSGCVLAVLLHGAAGPRFSREHKALGGLMLGVPDAAYSHWILRLDLLRVALFGAGELPLVPRQEEVGQQRDEVFVRLKKGRTATGIAS